MPIGFEPGGKALSTNFGNDQWQQAERVGVSQEEHKKIVREAYHASDGAKAFAQALNQRGYVLAEGRRGFMAVDPEGGSHAVARAVGQRKKEVEAKLGNPTSLPSVKDAQKAVQDRTTPEMDQLKSALKRRQQEEMKPYEKELHDLRLKQRAERKLFKAWEHQQQVQLETTLAHRYRKGLLGLVDRVTGEFARTTEQNKREREATHAVVANKYEAMIQTHTTQRRLLRGRMDRLSRRHEREAGELRRQVGNAPEQAAESLALKSAKDRAASLNRRRSRRRHHHDNFLEVSVVPTFL